MFNKMMRFAEVVDCGGISAAARKLYITQPAVTKSLKQLEDHYGVALLVRGKQGVVPTEYGKIVYQLAKLMAKSMSDVDEEIGAKRTKEESHLSIGVGLLWSYIYLPDALVALSERMPEVDIDISLRPPLELHDMVCDGRLDIAVGEMPRERHAGIVYEELLVSKSVVFIHSSHPLKSRRTISEAHLRQYPWVVFAISGKEIIAASDDETDKNVTRLANLLLACLLMQKGNHVMRLPLALAPILKQFGIEPIKHKASEHEFVSGLFYRKSALLRTTSREMIKEIRSVE
jgi:DNA-binding transcriptional LysR family regulator